MGRTTCQAEDGVHAVLRGTSQATPYMSRADWRCCSSYGPISSITQARELLRTTGKTDLALPSYGPRRGFGLLDLKAAVAALRGSPTAPGEVSPLQSDLGSNFDQLTPGYGEAILTVTPRDANGLPLGPGHQIEIERRRQLHRAGALPGSPSDSFGRYERAAGQWSAGHRRHRDRAGRWHHPAASLAPELCQRWHGRRRPLCPGRLQLLGQLVVPIVIPLGAAGAGHGSPSGLVGPLRRRYRAVAAGLLCLAVSSVATACSAPEGGGTGTVLLAAPQRAGLGPCDRDFRRWRLFLARVRDARRALGTHLSSGAVRRHL